MTKVQKYIASLRDKNIHIVGISGSEGCEIALFLSKHRCKNLTLHDFSLKDEIKRHFRSSHSGLDPQEREERFSKLMKIDATFHFQDSYLKDIENADIIFVPQSWYLYKENSELKEYEQKDKLYTLTKLYFQLFPGKIIAVTGSNGKTTTSNMIAGIFEAASHHRVLKGKYYFTGNDRRMSQILSEIENATAEDFLITEVSNRQLRINPEKSPDIGVITNITPNHLNEYDSWEDYRNAKLSLLKYQSEEQVAVLNYDDKESRNIIEHEEKNVFGFSLKDQLHAGAYLRGENLVVRHGDKEEVICKKGDVKILGDHNIANALAASAAAFLAHIPANIISEAIGQFAGVPQRLELVQEIQGRKFYNDTSSTTPESTVAALMAFLSPVILIMGGNSKGGDYEELNELLKTRTKKLILIKSPLAKLVHGEAEVVDNLKQAVDTAWEASEKGDSIILSPGGEYFCYFQDKMPSYKNYRTFVERLSKSH